MKAGRALRDQWRADRLNKLMCACGHRMTGHREYAPTYAIVEGNTIIETPHPRFAPGLFRCEACECEVRS